MAERPLRRSDFRKVFERGTYLTGDQLALRCLRRTDDRPSRNGFVIPRKIGGAVARNRLRRRLRAILQKLPLASGYDCVWVVRKGTPRDHEALRGEMLSLLEKSGMLGGVVAG